MTSHVITAPEISRVVGKLDVPAILHRFLAAPVATRPAAVALAGMVPRLLATIEDGRARRVMARLVPRILGGPTSGLVAARALRGLVEGGRHQEVFGFILAQLKSLLAGKEETLRKAIEDTIRDPEFLAEAEKTGSEIIPMTGEETAAAIRQILATPKDVIERVKNVLARQ